MKIEIDLNDILGDEYGEAEQLGESIKRQIVESLTKTISEGIGKRIDRNIAETIQNGINEAIQDRMGEFVETVIDSKYTPVSTYGDRVEEITFRSAVSKHIVDQMQYKTSRYDSDRNLFTAAVDELVKAKVTEFKKDFNNKVDELFTEQALAHATTALKLKLGIK